MSSPTSGSLTPVSSAVFSKTVAEKRLTFQALLANELEAPYTLAAFEDFLRTREHSEENLEFLEAIKNFRGAKGSADAKAIANTIVETYLLPGSPKEVNCPNLVRKKVVEDVQTGGRCDPETFSPVEAKILELMRLSSFPHFVRFVEGKQISPSDARPTSQGAQ